MKKWLIALAVIIILAIGSSYIFIPGTLAITKTSVLTCNIVGANRVLSEEGSWKKWWPGSAEDSRVFNFNNTIYQVTPTLNNRFFILIGQRQDTISSVLELLPLSSDSVAIQWKCTLTASRNPVKRIERYREAVAIKKNMDTIVSSLRSFLAKKENIYHFDIRKVMVIDSNLISTKAVFPAYPGIHEIYALIKKLQDYVALQKARQTGHPMMHVTKKDSTHFELMVAIPTERVLNDDGGIGYKHMIPGPILMTEVKGGRAIIDQAYAELENFKMDHNITSPAIPFESMVTDRSAEPDAARWITRVYYPVIPF